MDGQADRERQGDIKMKLTHEFTKTEQKEIRALVNECANYDRQDKICLLTDGPCYMLMKLYNNGKICKYFKDAVLPLNTILEASITHKEPVVLRKCEMCKKDFIPKTSNQLYCSDNCKKTGNRMRSRERMQKMRDCSR